MESRVPVQKSNSIIVGERNQKKVGQNAGNGRIGERPSITTIFIGGLVLGSPDLRTSLPSILGNGSRDSSPDPCFDFYPDRVLQQKLHSPRDLFPLDDKEGLRGSLFFIPRSWDHPLPIVMVPLVIWEVHKSLLRKFNEIYVCILYVVSWIHFPISPDSIQVQ
jgi:hypothetical protein